MQKSYDDKTLYFLNLYNKAIHGPARGNTVNNRGPVQEK